MRRRCRCSGAANQRLALHLAAAAGGLTGMLLPVFIGIMLSTVLALLLAALPVPRAALRRVRWRARSRQGVPPPALAGVLTVMPMLLRVLPVAVVPVVVPGRHYSGHYGGRRPGRHPDHCPSHPPSHGAGGPDGRLGAHRVESGGYDAYNPRCRGLPARRA